MSRFLVVFLGGGLGSLARFLVGTWVFTRWGGRFPFATFLINITGSFLIGVLMTLFTMRVELHPLWRLGLVVGFLGGYTTFSSFEWETYTAAKEGAFGLGLLYVLSSVVAGYAAVWLGAAIMTRR